MAKVSFDTATAQQSATQPIEQSAPAQAVQVIPAQAVQVIPAPSALPSNQLGDDGPIDLSQIRLPKINIVQRIGELSTIFKPGDILLNRTLVVPQPATLVVLTCRPRDQFAEKVSGAEGGRLFDTKEEVASAGGTTDFNLAKATKRPLFRPLATFAVLIEKPESIQDSPLFRNELDGQKYGFFLWSMVGALYTEGAKTFRTAKMTGAPMDLTQGYPTGKWIFTTATKKYNNGNIAEIPVLTPGGPTTLAFQEAAAKLLAALTGRS